MNRSEIYNRIREYSKLSATFVLLKSSAYSQVIYSDIDPDIIVGPDNQIIDINDDSFYDFEFHAELLFSSNTLWECYSTILFEIECLHPENSLIGYAVDGMKDVVYALAYGYPINALAGLTPDALQFVTFKWQEVSCLYGDPVGPWFYPNEGHWASHRGEDVYIGFKFYTGEGECPRFGWMRCYISKDLEQITIKDLAYNEDCGKGLFSGMMISDIQDPQTAAIFANLYIENSSLNIFLTTAYPSLYCNIYDMSGQLVLRSKITDLETSILLDNYNAGLYHVQLIAADGVKLAKSIFVD